MTGQQEYRITEEEIVFLQTAIFTDREKCAKIVANVRSRPVQASRDSNLNEQFPFPLDAKDAKDAKYWLTKEQWTDIMYSVVGISPYQSKDPDDMTDYPIPDGEAILKTIRINQKMTNCEQAIRKDERERAIHPPIGDDYCLSCKRDPLVENYCKTCNIPRSDPKELRKQGEKP